MMIMVLVTIMESSVTILFLQPKIVCIEVIEERVIEVKMYKIRELSKRYLGIYCDNGVVFSDICNCG